MLVRNMFLKARSVVWRCYSSSSANSSPGQKSLNRDLEKLLQTPSHKLAYRVVKLQRLVDSYQKICDPVHFCGKDKLRVDHPDPDEIIVGTQSTRKIALKILYRGWDYLGYAWEDFSWNQQMRGCTNVVERVLLEALLRQQIIPHIGSLKNMRMERCGRTDRLVSGVSQVVSLRVRSNLDRGYGVWSVSENSRGDVYDAHSDEVQAQTTTTYHEDGLSISDISLDEGEVPYVDRLNEALPLDIRVLAWSPVGRRFSSRFDCNRRTYRYVFPRGALDLDLMNEAAQKFVGKHDFRNFCKKSADNLFKHFEREIFFFKVEDLGTSSNFPECDLCAATISAHSFLQRQIRKMMAMLTMIGLGNVPMDKIDELLDPGKSPRYQGYSSCNAVNLVLVDCAYDDLAWRWSENALAEAARATGSLYGEHAVKAEVLRHMYATMCAASSNEETRKDAALHITESLVTSSADEPLKLNDELSKSVEEKQEAVIKREVGTYINRGAYRKAAALHKSREESSV